MKYFPGPQHTLADVPVQRGMSTPVHVVCMPHEAQVEAPEALYEYGGQYEHAVWPPWYEYVPAGQAWQAVSVPSRK